VIIVFSIFSFGIINIGGSRDEQRNMSINRNIPRCEMAEGGIGIAEGVSYNE
jgi:hypothetical protein